MQKNQVKIINSKEELLKNLSLNKSIVNAKEVLKYKKMQNGVKDFEELIQKLENMEN